MPSSASARAARPATRNLVAAMLAAPRTPPVLVSQSAVGYYGDRGDQVVDESTPAGSTFDAQVCVAWEAAAAEARRRRRPARDPAHRPAPDQGRRAARRAPAAVQARRRRPGRRRSQLHAVDQPRRRDRPDALGARHEGGRRRLQRLRPEPGHQPRVLQVARPGARPAGDLPVPKLAVKLRVGAELAEVATGGQRALPRRAQDEGYVFRYPRDRRRDEGRSRLEPGPSPVRGRSPVAAPPAEGRCGIRRRRPGRASCPRRRRSSSCRESNPGRSSRRTHR